MVECKEITANRLNILTVCSGEAANTAGKSIIKLSKKLQEKKHTVVIITTQGEWLHEIKALGVRWHEAPSILAQTPYGIFKSAKIMKNIITAEKIDLIHVHSIFHALEAYIARATLPNKRAVPIIMTVHILRRGKRWAYYIGAKALNILTDFVTTVSAFERERLIKAGLKQTKIQVIYNAVNLTECDMHIMKPESFEFPRMIQKPAFVGIIARLSPEKNHKCFLEAAAQVKKSFPETKFLIVGEGPLKDELEKLTKRLGLEKDVMFMGFQKNIYKVLKDMDILVLPSVRETFGIVLIEAMAMGKPVIATKVGGIPEVVKDRETGLLVSPGDSTALSQAIEALLKDRELSQRLSIQGRLSVEAKFNLDVTVGQIEDLYKKAISKRRGLRFRNITRIV